MASRFREAQEKVELKLDVLGLGNWKTDNTNKWECQEVLLLSGKGDEFSFKLVGFEVMFRR